MMPDRRLLLDGLVDAAVAAGCEILDVYAGDIAVTTKADASPVTAADGRAEAVILAALARLAPDIPVIAEESVAAGCIPEVGACFFLVDPLDGTMEFIGRNGEFTVNIGLVEDGRPTLGVVYAPVFGRLFAGGGDVAFTAAVADGVVGPPMPIAVRPVPAAGLTVVGSRSHGSAQTADFLRALPVADYRVAGSSLKFCLLAAGEADLYPRFGRTMQWDTAAGDAVLRAAGGRVTDAAGAPLAYGRRGTGAEAFANPDFIAATAGAFARLGDCGAIG